MSGLWNLPWSTVSGVSPTIEPRSDSIPSAMVVDLRRDEAAKMTTFEPATAWSEAIIREGLRLWVSGVWGLGVWECATFSSEEVTMTSATTASICAKPSGLICETHNRVTKMAREEGSG